MKAPITPSRPHNGREHTGAAVVIRDNYETRRTGRMKIRAGLLRVPSGMDNFGFLSMHLRTIEFNGFFGN